MHGSACEKVFEGRESVGAWSDRKATQHSVAEEVKSHST